MSDFYFSTQQLTVGYDGVPLIRDITIDIAKGEIVTLIGPNGSGKSTILKSITRQLKLIGGRVFIASEELRKLSYKDLSTKMAVVLTERMKPELMTCRDIVATGRYPYTGRLGLLTEADHAIVREAIRTVHAEDFADRPFTQISDGQRQRLLLARAICQEPEVIVLDEPTSFLDVKHKLELLEILKRLVRERNVAVVMSLHELDLAQKISDRVVSVTKDGVDRCDTPENIFQSAYIEALYGMESGSYNALFGSLEMARVSGKPRVFVIGGAGNGIPVYRALQRRGVPFAAGVLSENDVDYWVARALAVETVSMPAFAPLDEGAVAKASALIVKCDHVVCCLDTFGELNQGNRSLRDEAQRQGKLLPLDRLSELWTGGDR